MEQTSRLSKGSEIIYTKLNMQSYLKPGNNLSVIDMRTIFMIRMRNLNIKCNFPSMYNDRKCIVPQCSDEDSQFHLYSYSCQYLEENTISEVNNGSYYDIFSNNVRRQCEVMNIIMQHFMTRQTILSSQMRRDETS